MVRALLRLHLGTSLHMMSITGTTHFELFGAFALKLAGDKMTLSGFVNLP